jgi:hypothetical protein
MQGFRAALVITGFVLLGVGSNLAWHYPRPVALGLQRAPSQLLAESALLNAANIRCRPNPDWSDLLVESEQLVQARQVLQGQTPPESDQVSMTTPPDLLAELGRLPGVKESNVWIRNEHEAVVTLAMRHGAFAADPLLLQRVVDCVGRARPDLDPDNIKVLDERGSDLNYSSPVESAQLQLSLQKALQLTADATVGPKQALVCCHLSRSQDFRIHLRASLLLSNQANQQKGGELGRQITQSLQKWTDSLNTDLQGKNDWRAEALIYTNLGETGDGRRALDREHGVILDELEVKDWPLSQRTLSQDYTKMARWGLTAPVPTPWQLSLGLIALGPAIFGWCLLLPRLISRHRLAL